jgi:hypothetical protein
MATNKNPTLKSSSSTATTTKNKPAVEQPNNPNLESFACLWLDQDVDSTEDNRGTQQELRQVINHLRTFHSSDQCEQYIQQINHEKVVLIVSGSLGRQVVPRLHSLPQFSACYVFCQDKKTNEQWASKYQKVIHSNYLLKTELSMSNSGQRCIYSTIGACLCNRSRSKYSC